MIHVIVDTTSTCMTVKQSWGHSPNEVLSQPHIGAIVEQSWGHSPKEALSQPQGVLSQPHGKATTASYWGYS